MENFRLRAVVLVTTTFCTSQIIHTRRAQDRSIHTLTISSSAHRQRSDETRTNAFYTNLPINTDTHETLPITFLHNIWTLT